MFYYTENNKNNNDICDLQLFTHKKIVATPLSSWKKYTEFKYYMSIKFLGLRPTREDRINLGI